jgi:hypothetical protein
MPPMMFAFARVDKARADTRMLRRGIIADEADLRLADTGFGTCGFPAPQTCRMQLLNTSQVLNLLAVGDTNSHNEFGSFARVRSREVSEWTAPDRRTIRLPILKA